MTLQDYRSKRDFKRSPEPPAAPLSPGRGPLTFVVQKHAARQLHYDFRLELDGVLKSWAVAKGPSYDPATKHLAVLVEDHPLDYGGFEGVIPPGEYGAGQVIVWDRGIYSPDENGELSFDDRDKAQARMTEGLAAGKLSVTLRGSKLKGSWTLVKMQRTEKNWLLIKHRDTHADPQHDILAEEASVISGVTIDDLKAGRLPTRKDPVDLSAIPGAVKATFPAKLAPMLASLAPTAFSGDDWLFEPKLDGFRTLAFLDNGRARLLSRRGIDVTEHYPAVAQSVANQSASQSVLDGEVIALDARGKICFQCLQGLLKSIAGVKVPEAEPPSAIIYYVFDILYTDGYDLQKTPLLQRKQLLKTTLRTDENLRLVAYFPANGETVYRAAVENGLEGVIAKRTDSRYEPGKRSDKWLKIKAVSSDEFVVGGFTQGSGNRAGTFGALLLGYYDENGKLLYAGNVGSGFDNTLLENFKKRLDKLVTGKSPFSVPTEPADSVTWVKPQLVVEVKYAERTRDGRLRAPVFLRLRDDKPAETVRPSGAVEIKGRKPAKAVDIVVKKVGTLPAPNRPGELTAVLEQLAGPPNSFTLEVEGKKLALTNLDKTLWPEQAGSRALTKRNLIVYLARVSRWLLPHLKDRPLSLNRFPNGIYGEHFFQKHYQPVPSFVETVPLTAHDRPREKYLLCNNLPTLLWLGQIADLELHTWFSRVKTGPDFKAAGQKTGDADFFANYPDFIIFDIDPYIYSGKESAGDEPELNRAAFRQTCRAALQLKETLDKLAFPSFVKTSGKTGLHVFVPILRRPDFRAVHAAAETFSRFLVGQNPAGLTAEWAVEKRTGKIFLDYNQNVRGKTLAAIYSPRPTPQATVSMPLGWEELEKAYPTDFTILNAPERLEKTGDLWQEILRSKVDLEKAISGFNPG